MKTCVHRDRLTDQILLVVLDEVARGCIKSWHADVESQGQPIPRLFSDHVQQEEIPMAILGIDISKTTFDATLIDDTGTRHHQQFANTAAGFPHLHRWLSTFAVSTLHACMEATNIYWEDLADDLFRHGYRVSVVNPARTKGFALSQLQRNKTDKVDSGSLPIFVSV